MTDNITYQMKQDKISEQRMQFVITNRRPDDPIKGKETVKAEIERQLFAVFCKYVRL